MEASVYPNQPETLQETVALLERAYLYAYPLVLMGVIKDRTTNVVVPDAEHAPINQLFHAQALATPDMVSLTRPNVDTVYSQAYLDLGAEPILLYKPATDRYCSIQTFDGYSNTPVVLGTGGVGGSDTATYAFVGPFWSGELPQGVTKVSMPTNFVWLLLRTKCFGVDDLPGVREVQQGMRMYPLSAHALDEGAGYACPKGSYDPAYDYVPLEFMQRLSVQDFFTRFNGLASGNPGAPEDAPALAQFETVGIGAGLTFDIAALGEGVTKAAAYLPTLLDRDFSSAHASTTVSNGWMFMDDRVGTFGTDYAYRAVVAFGGFANPVTMAVYPSMVVDVAGNPLRGDKSYRLHFAAGETPPHASEGWWSLTAYTEAGRLIPNELNRYNIGEVDDLPFNEDGSLDLYLQAEGPADDRVRFWLPLCEDVFSLTMRIYLPDERVLSFDWKLPPLEAV
ncbi:DUF1254 domain-containing protein [Paraeggerthella hongkongensis]|uniref:DUF1254 domain-containing protein n=1 Tax=Paraeggerthella hominis TaxID=2897351 RepID=UPI001C10931E|nr:MULTISPECIES: DUF1254 domain-containing protein [Paraeggerthella]MBU5405826.1 DUF1254 domain-containing protein [Paraeggerthella hongkongensis]MCD2433673.1 DUF1254 domain-containing protein [Paraeggerthella hominis]